jgi:hypothetical protein
MWEEHKNPIVEEMSPLTVQGWRRRQQWVHNPLMSQAVIRDRRSRRLQCKKVVAETGSIRRPNKSRILKSENLRSNRPRKHSLNFLRLMLKWLLIKLQSKKQFQKSSSP